MSSQSSSSGVLVSAVDDKDVDWDDDLDLNGDDDMTEEEVQRIIQDMSRSKQKGHGEGDGDLDVSCIACLYLNWQPGDTIGFTYLAFNDSLHISVRISRLNQIN